jgi:hypothetical protein
MAEWRPLASAVLGIEALRSSLLNEVSFGSTGEILAASK